MASVVVFMVTTHWVVETQGLPTPPWVMLLVFTIAVIDLFQALLLEQIDDSASTLRKNLDR